MNRKVKNTLLSIEILLGYGPAALLWLLGSTIGVLISVEFIYEGYLFGYLGLLAIPLGAVGLHGAKKLVQYVFEEEIAYPISRYAAHLLAGILALSLFVYVFDASRLERSDGFTLVFVLVPVVVTSHLYILALLKARSGEKKGA